jgi:hypothetical protein
MVLVELPVLFFNTSNDLPLNRKRPSCVAIHTKPKASCLVLKILYELRPCANEYVLNKRLSCAADW